MDRKTRVTEPFANWTELARISAQYQPKRYLEVGVESGGSLARVLDNCTPNQLTLCDLWDPVTCPLHPYTNHDHVAAMLETMDYHGEVTYLDGDSHGWLPKLSTNFLYDLIHVDGDHSEEGAAQDLRDCWLLLAPGGHIVFDDVCRPSLYRVLRKFCQQLNSELHIVMLDLSTPDGVATMRKVR